MTELRKVFICKSCEGIYADDPVTACDCMPSKSHVYEFEQSYIVGEDTCKMVLDLLDKILKEEELTYQNVCDFIDDIVADAQAIKERLEARN